MNRNTISNFREMTSDHIGEIESSLYIYNGVAEGCSISTCLPGTVFVDANNIPANLKTYDLVFVTGCLEYADDPFDFCSYVLDLVKVGGMFYISTVFGGNDMNALWRFTTNGLEELFRGQEVEIIETFYETDGVGVVIWGRKLADPKAE